MLKKEHGLWMTRTVSSALLLWGTLEISKLAFSSTVKRELATIDQGVCQRQGCERQESLTLHHLVPESLRYFDFNRDLSGAGTYVTQFHQRLEPIVEALPPGKRAFFLYELKLLLNSSDNAITLCQGCHNALHRGKLQAAEVILKSNPDMPHRPTSCDSQEVFPLFDHMIAEALQKRGLQHYVHRRSVWR